MNNDTVIDPTLKLTKLELDSLRDIFVLEKLGSTPIFKRIAQIERDETGALDIKVMLRVRINESKEKRQLVRRYRITGKAISKLRM